MGNQLVGIAPSQIFPVEHYFTGAFESDLQFDSSMGSTRFFKVAKARSEEGFVAVKVFIKQDPTLPIEAHAARLETIKKSLANAVNCLPFQRVVLTDKVSFIMREYVKHSLYDRVSTRPFLTVLEKKWITFQILCALNQCHKQKICHGDIKLENILITSWNWILLSDFASFKPTYLPEDNPADYTYFFDTSRRRTCYIAPERFTKPLSEGNQTKETTTAAGSVPMIDSGRDPANSEHLIPEMDIFSAGCALLELWTEGAAPFEFSQLLIYRGGDEELVSKHLQGIQCKNLRNLLSSMLSRNPKERKTAEIYLDQERGRLFPEYFYSFLQSYLQMFSSTPLMSPDDKILRLHSDISHFIKVLTVQSDDEGLEEGRKEEGKEKIEKESDKILSQSEEDGLILIITVVTSNIRGLNHCNTKMCCLEILQKLAHYTTSETILDRILPYIIYLTKDQPPRVQVSALMTLTVCLGLVKEVPRSDANVFPEYILPAIAPLATDCSVTVRTALAKYIADLAETSVYFLEQTQIKNPNEFTPARYEAELSALHEIVQQVVLSLLTDTQPIVKQTLMESGITKLCVFFGKHKANDVVLSHMITFLNDKEDRNLRGAFFDCIVGVVAYVGWQSSDILIPLLQQGLTDSEEFVITKAIRATTALIELGLIQKPALTVFISECASYLNHPNLWIRHEICGLISTTARILSPIDVQCKIMPAVTNYIKTPLIQVEKPEILLDCLLPPIPRNIFDSIVKFPDIQRLIRVLEERNAANNSVDSGDLPQCGEMGTALKNLFRRLMSEGLTPFTELQLLSMKSYLIKLNKYKNQEPKNTNNGRIILSRKSVPCHEFPLSDKGIKNERNNKKLLRPEGDNGLNSDWQHIYGTIDGHSPIPSSPSNDSGSPVVAGSPPSGSHVQATPTSSLVEYSLPDRSFVQERASECRVQLECLRNKIKTRYMVLASNRDYNPSQFHSAIPPGWKMGNNLVAHLHEHSNSVVKLAPLKPYGPLFASGSIDGTVRLWDCNRLNGNQSINRSRQVYSANTPIYSVAACDAGQSLAIGGKDGTILILRIDRNSTKMTLQQALHLDGSNTINGGRDDGAVVDMQPLDQSVIIYATLYGSIVAWDLRVQNHVWRLENNLRHGVTTSFCVDPTSSWLAAGTSGGKHIAYDLRFRLPINEIRHPFDSWIRKVVCHPTEPSWLISTSQSNNEVSIWNIETGHRQAAFWGSKDPALSNPNHGRVDQDVSTREKKEKELPITINGLYAGVVDDAPFILTGSTDQRIRWWDPSNYENCSVIVPASNDHLTNTTFTYKPQIIDGSRVTIEISSSDSNASGHNRSFEEQSPRSGPEMPSPSHHDSITDFVLCKTDKQQLFVVSGSRDGVIKLWK